MSRRNAVSVMLALLACAGCAAPREKVPAEPDWIREGQPLVYEGANWLPQRRSEVFAESDLEQVGEYRGVPFFAERADLKPYATLYTTLGPYEYRAFKKERQ
jgi:hypothetical protein